MATRCITITDSSYKKLLAKKYENESFSGVIDRLVSEDSFDKLIGVLTNEEAEELKKHIKENRKKMRKRSDKIAEMLA